QLTLVSGGGAPHPEPFALPADASVTVDGALVTPSDGHIDIEGSLGSVHDVVVRVGKQERKVTVSVTDKGALPDVIELPASQPHPGGGPLRPSGTSQAKVSPPATAAPDGAKGPANVSRTDPDLR